MPSKHLPINDLKPHPEHSQIYSTDDQLSELTESIKTHGVMEPILVTDENIIISGHRRIQAAIEAGLTRVPIERINPDDQVLAMIESNQFRKKTPMMLFNESEHIGRAIRHEAHDRKREGGRTGGKGKHRKAVSKSGQSQTSDQKKQARRSDDEIAKKIGISRGTLRSLQKVMKTVTQGIEDKDEFLMDIHGHLSSGKYTIDKANKMARDHCKRIERNKIFEESKGTYSVQWEDLLVYVDIWDFPARDKRFDRAASKDAAESSSFGAPPPQTWVNLIARWTQPGDVILDPFAGEGGVLDVAVAMNRECLAYDLNPKRKDIEQHDVTTGMPKTEEPPKLIVLDPPYFDQKIYSDDSTDLSNAKSLEKFYEQLEAIIESALNAIDSEGRVAVIIGNALRNQTWYDLAWDTGKIIERHGTIEQRIQVPYPKTFHSGFRVENAKKNTGLLPITRELFIVQRREDQM